ncbi:18156_t:CDS:2, partial [Rhizophagus irregularis]
RGCRGLVGPLSDDGGCIKSVRSVTITERGRGCNGGTGASYGSRGFG